MGLFIAKSFTESLARMQAADRESVIEAAEFYQANPAHPGLRKHRLEKCRDPGFWSLRSSRDIRIILHDSEHGTLFCYADHHDKAYAWAEKRKLAANPTTGAMQMVVLRELAMPEMRRARAAPARDQRRPLFANLPRTEFAWMGVPDEWVDDARSVRSEDELLELITCLPEEAGEALLTLAGGGKPRRMRKAVEAVNPFLAADAVRRFYAVDSAQALRTALAMPWDDWRIFLHPDQRKWVEAEYDGDARLCGGPGTGKTVVALHRAVHLARQAPTAHILLTTISRALAASLVSLVRRLAGDDSTWVDRIIIRAIDTLPELLLDGQATPSPAADERQVRDAIKEAQQSLGLHGYSEDFLLDEWGQVIEAADVRDGASYAALTRQGRLVRLTRIQRQVVWRIIERATDLLAARGVTAPFRQVRTVARMLAEGRLECPFDYIIADECQDLRHEHLVLLSAMRKTPQSLFFVGDLGQRVRQPLVSWRSAGIDIVGCSHTLKVNYRTSHQIQALADRFVAGQFQDADGVVEDRRQTVSVFSGTPPSIREYMTEEEEQFGVARWLEQLFEAGIKPQECCLFVRTRELLARAEAVAGLANCGHVLLDEGVPAEEGAIALATMPYAEGLEFKAVAVMACDAWSVPLQSRLDSAMRDTDADDIRAMERQLLYVAATRARDYLLLSGCVPLSDFLASLDGA